MSSTFKNIVDLERWQRVQDHFSQVLRVALRTLDKDGSLITKPSKILKLCEEVLRSSSAAISTCTCYPRALERFELNWKEGQLCEGGLYNFFVPLQIKKETLAYLMVGPVILGKRQDETVYRQAARNLGKDPDEFFEAVCEIKVFSFYGIKSVIELLYDIGSYTCELGYQNAALKEIVPDVPNIIPRVHDFYVDKLLDALLEISFSFTGAERGSIMLFDESREELYIKAAKGLTDEIIKNARSRIGEGIAGIVAAENKPIFINEDVEDVRIRSQLNNPNIRQSIGIPINVDNEMLGVLNLATSKDSSEKFTCESVTTVDRLRQLVEATLGGVSPADIH